MIEEPLNWPVNHFIFLSLEFLSSQVESILWDAFTVKIYPDSIQPYLLKGISDSVATMGGGFKSEYQ